MTKNYGPHPDREFRIIVATCGLIGAACLGLSRLALGWPVWALGALTYGGGMALTFAVAGWFLLRFSPPPTGWDK